MKYILLISFSICIQISSAQVQKAFQPITYTSLTELFEKASVKGEVDNNQLKKLASEYKDMENDPSSANAVFDYGRILTAILQPGLSKATENSLSQSSISIIEEAEKAYHYAISNCKCHGRANIMLGLLYNQQGKYYISESFLEKGLKLPEGEEDWMVAANQYLLAGAYTYNTDTPKYQSIYKLFKQYAPKTKKNGDYYRKMAGLYKTYYE